MQAWGNPSGGAGSGRAGAGAGIFEGLLKHLPGYLRPFVEAAYITGWRRSELRWLRWPQVEWEGGTIRLERGTTKSGEPRSFPFAVDPRLAARLHEQRERAPDYERANDTVCAWVFHRNGHQVRWNCDGWKTACRKTGVPGRLLHDLRRSALRRLAALHGAVTPD